MATALVANEQAHGSSSKAKQALEAQKSSFSSTRAYILSFSGSVLDFEQQYFRVLCKGQICCKDKFSFIDV